MAQVPFSIFLITRNEADRIAQTLMAVRELSDDIVVVDSGSTDATVEIATQFGARVFSHQWQGYGLQKRFAEEQCRHRWLFNLDADEVVPAPLADEIRQLFAQEPACQGYTVPIAEVFPGEKAPHPWAYALKPVRLYLFTAGRYVESPVHDRVLMKPQALIGHLKTPIHHFSVRSLGDQIDKLNRYSDMQAQDLAQRHVQLPAYRIFFEFPAAFFKAYFMRRHFLRGIYGFMTAMNYAFSRHLRLAKHLEISQREKKA